MIEELKEQIEELKEQIDRLQIRIADLEDETSPPPTEAPTAALREIMEEVAKLAGQPVGMMFLNYRA
jgi:cell division septum initiation protein DivIVA